MALHGRSLLFVRNVGHLMTNPAVLRRATDARVPEGILDAVITSRIALHDLKRGPARLRNSRTRLDLHRQAEDARPAGGGVRQ